MEAGGTTRLLPSYGCFSQTLTELNAVNIEPIMSPSPVYPCYHFKRRDRISVDTYTLWQVRSGLVRSVTWSEDGAENFGQPASHGRLIIVRLTHQEIAETIGTSRVTVTRFIKHLEEAGLLRWSGRERFVSNQALKAHQKELMIAWE